METHLSDGQIEDLLQGTWESNPGSMLAARAGDPALQHLKICESCRARVMSLEVAMERLAKLKTNASGMPTPQCPPEQVWLELAAGIEYPNSADYLSHAADCDHCGPLLSKAVAELSTELTPEEDSMISALPSSSPHWQKTFAAKLSKSGSSAVESQMAGKWPTFWRSPLFRPGRIVLVSSVLVAVVIGAVWFRVHWTQGVSPEQLIASAYAEKRTLEVRIEGAPYVPLRQLRGSESENRMSRPALLKAEAEIAEKLAVDPDNVGWLQASGRASMLEGDEPGVEAALVSLKKASRLAPNDASVTIDLASAHILLDQLHPKSKDQGEAIGILEKLVLGQQGGEVALYNYALALEAQNLKSEAVKQWNAFLEKYPNSGWAPEARDRMAKLVHEVSERKRRSDAPLKTAEQVATAFDDHDDNATADIDGRIEEYQDLAIQVWLPVRYSGVSSKLQSATASEQALDGLAKLLAERHGDPWLKELLQADPNSQTVTEAVRLLADSSMRIETSDESLAEQEAAKAASLFRQSASVAGEKRAQLVLILAQQYEHGARPCEAMAQGLLNDAALRRYTWIRIQALLEACFCARMTDRKSLQQVQAGFNQATEHRYPTLILRSLAAESGLYSALGDSRQAWSAATEGLRTFWTGTYPALRGYNALIAMDEVDFPRDNWYLDAAILKEAIPLVKNDPRTTMVAVGEARLGQALMQVGDFEGAQKSYGEAERLLNLSSPGLQRTALSAEAELGFAKVDLHKNNLAACLDRLERIRPIFANLPNDLQALDFLGTVGIAEFRAKHLVEANRDLNAAIRLSEKGLREADNESDRWKWSHQNEPVYRALVELKLDSNPEQALLDWEWYKGAALRGRDQDSSPGQLSSIEEIRDVKLPEYSHLDESSALISFAVFPNGYAVWVWDGRILHKKWVPVGESELSLEVMGFLEGCSEPRSDEAALRKEGAVLYRSLISPIEPWIAGRHHLIVETDGVLKTLPIGLLVEPGGAYMGDRFTITFSPGILYLNQARKWRGVTARSDVAVLGDPEAPGWMPLPDAEKEASVVAASFKHPRMLSRDGMSLPNLYDAIAASDVFHFSGHAQASNETASLVTGSTGMLEPRQLLAVKSGRTELVVLSACSSSLGTTGFFDDDDSLVRRLMVARVPEVVASRWMVDSAATALLMSGFYSELRTGASPSEALNGAMRNVRSRPEFSHPYFWAGFSVFGRS